MKIRYLGWVETDYAYVEHCEGRERTCSCQQTHTPDLTKSDLIMSRLSHTKPQADQLSQAKRELEKEEKKIHRGLHY
jgi:hypothetical protein